MPAEFYDFDSFRLEVASRRLLKDGITVALSSRAFDVLLELVKRSGEIISQEDLMNAVWHDQAVEPNNLSQAIKQIRRALGDTEKEHRYLITVPRQGFKFAANISVINENKKERIERETVSTVVESRDFDHSPSLVSTTEKVSPAISPNNFNKKIAVVSLLSVVIFFTAIFAWQYSKKSQTLNIKSIAVLPFKTFNPEPESDLLKMAMTDALITRLSRLEQIKVLPTSAVSRFNKPDQDPIAIGRELNVDAVLEGRVQKDGGRLRVTAQLIRTSDSNTIWAESYDEDFSGIFEVQYELARKITGALSLELSDEEARALMKRYTHSAKAYQLWLEGRQLFSLGTPDAVEMARKNFIIAINLDSKFAMAYTALANTYLLKPPANLNPNESFAKAKELARQAIEIDETLADAHASYAFAVWRGEWKWQEAEKHFQRAVDLGGQASNIYSWYSLLLNGIGQPDKAVIIFRASPVVNKLNFNAPLGEAYIVKRDYDKAIETFKEVLTRMSNDHNSLVGLSWAYTGKGDYEQVLEFIEKILTLRDHGKNDIRAVKAHILGRAGKTNEAGEILAQLNKVSENEPGINGARAIVYAALEEKDEAFRLLKKKPSKEANGGVIC